MHLMASTSIDLGTWVAILLSVASFSVSVLAWQVSSRQANLMSYQNDVNVVIFIYGRLLAEDVRQARRYLYTIARKPDASWTDDDDREARKVVTSFEAAFTITERSEWAQQRLLEDWGQQIVKCREAVKFRISRWRDDGRADRLFEKFEKLSRLAIQSEALTMRRGIRGGG